MFKPDIPEPELLKAILEPLLEDFQYWFGRSRALLESERISFLSQDEQANLLDRVQNAQKQVGSAQSLFKATDGQVGIDPHAMVPWHQLLTECWQVSIRFRTEQSAGS